MSALGRFHTHLRRNHISRTRQRDEIFEAIRLNKPPSISQLAKDLQPRIHKTLTYRTVSLFIKLDIVIQLSNKHIELTDRFTQHHHYRECRSCKRRDPFLDPALEKAIERSQKKSGFHLEDHRLELIGLCLLCQNNPKTKQRPSIETNLRRLPG